MMPETNSKPSQIIIGTTPDQMSPLNSLAISNNDAQNARLIQYLGSATDKGFDTFFCLLQQQNLKENPFCKMGF
jgi:hypothetical protein